MKLTLEPTDRIVTMNGQVKARLWQGTSEDGVPVVATIAFVQVDKAHDNTRFERELVEGLVVPRPDTLAIPLRLLV